MHGHRTGTAKRNLAGEQDFDAAISQPDVPGIRRPEVSDDLRRLFLEIAHSGILIRNGFRWMQPYDVRMTHSSRARTRLAVGLCLAVAALSLAGCSSTSTKPITDYRGEPKGVDAPPSSAGGAPFSVWLKDGEQFTITTYGSSSCPPVGTGLTVTGDNKMTIAIKTYPKDKVCTMDYSPHTTVFATPSRVDPHKDTKITVQDIRFTLQALPK